jgi:hypothetical protein
MNNIACFRPYARHEQPYGLGELNSTGSIFSPLTPTKIPIQRPPFTSFFLSVFELYKGVPL